MLAVKRESMMFGVVNTNEWIETPLSPSPKYDAKDLSSLASSGLHVLPNTKGLWRLQVVSTKGDGCVASIQSLGGAPSVLWGIADTQLASMDVWQRLASALNVILANITTVSYTHLTLPTKRIV